MMIAIQISEKLVSMAAALPPTYAKKSLIISEKLVSMADEFQHKYVVQIMFPDFRKTS